MKQIVQNLRSGETLLADIPTILPQKDSNHIRTTVSLISAGTERMLVNFGRGGIIAKAKQQPDKVRMVLDKIQTDGLIPTLEAVQAKLDQPLPMGYCNVGRVMETGAGSGFTIGDRTVSNGNHAELVNVPYNLCAKIPETVNDESAVFTVIGAIGLQGVRLAKPTLGECFVVTGLGLVGLMTVQLLMAHGCRVLGIDFDSAKCNLARGFGAAAVDLSKGEDPLAMAEHFSRGRGVDGVLICASSKRNEIVHQAAVMCRKRGRIVLVGVVGLELSRADFFEKELTFQVSCSYGPGRYDPLYEKEGLDYPVGYVRWTEQRNFEAVLDMMASGRIDVSPLVSHRFPLEQASEAYKVLAEDRSALGIVLQYPSVNDNRVDINSSTIILQRDMPAAGRDVPVIGFIGAGNYGGGVLIPAFKKTGSVLKTVASVGGVSGVHAGKKFGFYQTTTDTESLIEDREINAVVITTRHNSHAALVSMALNAGKHVFVEKPLCIHLDELHALQKTYRAGSVKAGKRLQLMVGFNRRFAPHVQKIKALLGSVPGPKSFVMTVNAGNIPEDHWTQDRAVGGGRIIGEACHFIDLLRFLASHPMSRHTISSMNGSIGDTATIELGFEDGSIGTLHYFTNGSKRFSKERLEVFAAGRILQLDNFRYLRGYGWPGFSRMNLWRQNKGQQACAAAFVAACVQGGPPPIPVDELFEVARVSIELAHA